MQIGKAEKLHVDISLERFCCSALGAKCKLFSFFAYNLGINFISCPRNWDYTLNTDDHTVEVTEKTANFLSASKRSQILQNGSLIAI